MNLKTPEKFRKDNSLEEFEFLDCDGNLDVDWSKSPLHEAAEKISSGISTVMSVLSIIADQEGMTVSVPVQALAATAVGAITGCILGGPPGLTIGLLTGAVIAQKTSPNKLTCSMPSKSTIKEVFSQMTFQQKKEMIKELLSCLKQSNVRSLILEILKNKAIRSMAMDIISNYIKKKMGVGFVRSGK